jgi:hypothetical protein
MFSNVNVFYLSVLENAGFSMGRPPFLLMKCQTVKSVENCSYLGNLKVLSAVLWTGLGRIRNFLGWSDPDLCPTVEEFIHKSGNIRRSLHTDIYRYRYFLRKPC